MAIAFRAASTDGNGTGITITVTKPTGTVDDDVVLIFLYYEGNGTTATTLLGFTSEKKSSFDSGGNYINVETFYKRAAGEGASWLFTLSGSVWRIASTPSYSGCITSGSPIDVSSGNTGNGGNMTALSLTTTVANTMLVAGGGNFNGVDIAAGSSGMTERAALGGNEAWDVAQAGAGASGNKVFSTTSPNIWAMNMVALKPAVAGAASLVIPSRRIWQAIAVR